MIHEFINAFVAVHGVCVITINYSDNSNVYTKENKCL